MFQLEASYYFITTYLRQVNYVCLICQGFGNANKLVMQWNQSFWNSQDGNHVFGLAANNWEDRYSSVFFLR